MDNFIRLFEIFLVISSCFICFLTCISYTSYYQQKLWLKNQPSSWPIEFLPMMGAFSVNIIKLTMGRVHFDFCGWYLDLPLGVVPLEEQDILSKANLKVGVGKTFVPLSEEDQVSLDTIASEASKLNVVLESPFGWR